MDERFRGRGIWIGLGVLAIVFLCVMLCGMGAMFATSRGTVYVQPPGAEEGAVAPHVYQGSFFGGRHGAIGPFAFIFGAIGLLLKLGFLGLLLLLLVLKLTTD